MKHGDSWQLSWMAHASVMFHLACTVVQIEGAFGLFGAGPEHSWAKKTNFSLAQFLFAIFH